MESLEREPSQRSILALKLLVDYLSECMVSSPVSVNYIAWFTDRAVCDDHHIVLVWKACSVVFEHTFQLPW